MLPPTPALYYELDAFTVSWDVLRGSYSCHDWLAHVCTHDDQSKGCPLKSTAVDRIWSCSEAYIPHIPCYV